MARECISSIEGAKEQMNRSGAEKREREVEKDGAGVGGDRKESRRSPPPPPPSPPVNRLRASLSFSHRLPFATGQAVERKPAAMRKGELDRNRATFRQEKRGATIESSRLTQKRERERESSSSSSSRSSRQERGRSPPSPPRIAPAAAPSGPLFARPGARSRGRGGSWTRTRHRASLWSRLAGGPDESWGELK